MDDGASRSGRACRSSPPTSTTRHCGGAQRPLSRAAADGVSPERLARFFTRGRGELRRIEGLRDLCVFSRTASCGDPPFSRIDLVSCRNLLIYLGSTLQDQVIPLFHYALRPGGFLFLGVSETVARHAELFTAEDKAHRIYRRRDDAVSAPPRAGDVDARPGKQRAAARGGRIRTTPAAGAGRRQACGSHHRREDRATPPGGECATAPWCTSHRDSANTSSRRRACRAGTFSPWPGSGLRLDLRAALREAAETHSRVVRPRVEIEVEDRRQAIALTVEPLPGGRQRPLFLVLFSDLGPPVPGRRLPRPRAGRGRQRNPAPSRSCARRARSCNPSPRNTSRDRGAHLRQRGDGLGQRGAAIHQRGARDLEGGAAIGQRGAAGDNLELTAKIEELDRANADLRNLFDSTQIATLFLDRHLVIRSFTPAVTTIFNLVPGDRGRPITDFTNHLDHVSLRREMRRALDEREPVERRVTARDGTVHYLMRMLPYRTTDGQVDGVVLTFFDITKVVEGRCSARWSMS
jgi:two-component system, chemotaxis family, CheB/CheR fusion protein